VKTSSIHDYRDSSHLSRFLRGQASRAIIH
jgi:hypothetical protein